MNLTGFLWLAFDGAVIATGAISTVIHYGATFRTILDRFIAGLLIGLTSVIASGLILGLTEMLTAAAWSIMLVAWMSWSTWRMQRQGKRFSSIIPTPTLRLSKGESWLIGGLGGVLFFFCVGAFLSEPTVNDSLCYRLPRIAQWEQTGSLWPYPTNDLRQLYMPFGPDLVMLWIIGHFETGFSGVVLAQVTGGILMMASIAGLARSAGLSRMAALGGSWFVLALPCVLAQFRTDQTDLFTAGIVSAGLHFSARRAMSGQWSVWAAFAWGLSFGCKGTMYYFVIGLIVWQLLLLKRRLFEDMKGLKSSIVAFTLGWFFFTSPTCAFNLNTFGNPFGPSEVVEKHHGAPGIEAGFRRLKLNFMNYSTQLMQISSQPPGIENLILPVAKLMVDEVPDQSRDSYYDSEGVSCRELMKKVVFSTNIDADILTLGPIPVLFTIWGLWKGRRNPVIIAAGLSGICFLVFFWYRQVWHPFGFLYLILGVPWMVVVALYAWPQNKKYSRYLALIFSLVFIPLASVVLGGLSQNGFAIYKNHILRDFQRQLSRKIISDGNSQWSITFPSEEHTMTSGLYRNGLKTQEIPWKNFVNSNELRELEDALLSSPDWIVVPEFIGIKLKAKNNYRILVIYPEPKPRIESAQCAIRALRKGEIPSFEVIAEVVFSPSP